MTDTILCVDIGTSSLKAALLSDNLKKSPIFVSRKAFPKSAFTEHNSAQFYLSALKDALSELHEKNPDYAIEAICVSGNGPTVIYDDGTTLLYSEALSLSEDFSENAYLRGSKSLFIPRFASFKSQFPEEWERSRRIFGAPEFLLHELTGEAISILPEERFLSAYWTSEELKKCGFCDSDLQKIPPFKKMGAFVGKVTEKAALATGLFEGTFVFAGAPDFVVALIGTGTVMPGRLCDRAGTSEGLNLCTSKPIFAEGLRTMPSVIPELWNLSYLMQNKENTDYIDEKSNLGKKTLSDKNNNPRSSVSSAAYFSELSRGINLLRDAAQVNGEIFPDFMTITGGQALNSRIVAQKERETGLKIKKMPCADAELIGDLILARIGLGDADDIIDGVFSYIPQF